jgi:hypothetical protein
MRREAVTALAWLRVAVIDPKQLIGFYPASKRFKYELCLVASTSKSTRPKKGGKEQSHLP